MPIAAYRTGNFTQALTGRNLGTDGLGRPIMENEIFDPNSTYTLNGVQYRNPFPNNIIPATELDRVALNVQSYIPLPNQPGLVNNYLPSYTNTRVSTIPSIKLDHSVSSRLKLSGYWGLTKTDSPNNMGFPNPIQNTIPAHIKVDTTRGNIDYTITPTLLLHVGGGYLYTNNDPHVLPFSPGQQLGFQGVYANEFPYFSTLAENTGGSAVIGPPTNFYVRDYKPTGTVSLTWVKNNHTFKFGGEGVVNRYPSLAETYAAGEMIFSPNMTADPSLNGRSLAATEGFDYASFLVGAPNNGYIATTTPQEYYDKSFAWYVQDSWKVTRKLTIDMGLRYDYETYIQERNNLMQNVAFFTPNPAAGGQNNRVAPFFRAMNRATAIASLHTTILLRFSPGWVQPTRSIRRPCCAPVAASPSPKPATILALTSVPTSPGARRLTASLPLLCRTACLTTSRTRTCLRARRLCRTMEST